MDTKMPDSWIETTIKVLSKQYRGVSYTKDDVSTIKGDNSILILRGGNIQDGKIVLSQDDVYVNERHVKPEQRLQRGDVVIVSSTGSKLLIGKAAHVKDDIQDIAFGAFLSLLRPVNEISFKYFDYFFQTDFYRRNIRNLSGGININNIRNEHLYNIPFPLAPLKEQKRIADKLDNLYLHLDLLNERLDRIPMLIKQFRENVLMQAVTGKLTEEWRKNRKPQKGPANGSTPFRIPNIWQWHKLGSLTKRISYGTSKKSDNEGKVPVLRMGNLQNGKLDWHDLKYSSDKKEIASYSLEPGDVLFNRTNSPELVGKTSIYEGEQPAIYAGYIIRIVTTEELNPYYLNFVLNSKYGRDWAWQVKSDGVSQSNINAKKLSAFEIPLPETDEQLEIVKQINGLFSIADRIEILYNELTTKLRKLPLTFLGKAFAGQLVSQDPNDEPASSLLQKITQMKAK